MAIEIPIVEVRDALKEVKNRGAAEEDSAAFVQYKLKETSEKERLELKEKADIIGMRRSWSNWILGVIIFITIFDFFVIIMLGFGIMKFDSSYALPAIITESIVKVIGLAYIIVNFLFNKDSLK